jgi:hypothetical protein
MPAGLLVTLPGPVVATVRLGNEARPKVAVMLFAASIVTVQVEPVPEQAPLQPVKIDPFTGVAVKVILVPKSKEALQVLPQSTPAGLEVTVPLPVPALVTVRGKVSKAKLAVTVRACVMLTVQGSVPVQSPVQPVKVEPEAGVAVRATFAPTLKFAAQASPQSMAVGVEVTVPVPVPAFCTLRL